MLAWAENLEAHGAIAVVVRGDANLLPVRTDHATVDEVREGVYWLKRKWSSDETGIEKEWTYRGRELYLLRSRPHKLRIYAC